MLPSLLILVFIISFILTWFLRNYTLQKQLLDLPNHRSSHVIPTPRGGGLAFVGAYLFTILFFKIINNSISTQDTMFLCVSGILIALIGWLDDRNMLAVRWRLLGHFLSSILAVYLLGKMPNIIFLGYELSPILIGMLVVFYLVWLLNLYNFMDGINGLAAIEAMSVCIGMALIYVLHNDSSLARLPMVLSVAVGGFLFWNFPKARIFMGDSGSSFLGFSLGLLSLLAAVHYLPYFCSWLILLGVFIVDSTCTLLYRLIKRCKIYEAHRSHAYQHATTYFKKHSIVTLGVLAINIIWLFPWALAVSQNKYNSYISITCAYIPLIVGWALAQQWSIHKANT